MLICSDFVGPGTWRGRHEVPFAMTLINANRSCAWSHSQHRKTKKNTFKAFFSFFTSKTLLILYGQSNQSCTSSALPVKYHKKTLKDTVFSLTSISFLSFIYEIFFSCVRMQGPCASSPRKSWLCFPPTFLTLLSHSCPAPSLSFAPSSSLIFHTLALHKPCCLKWHRFLYTPLKHFSSAH